MSVTAGPSGGAKMLDHLKSSIENIGGIVSPVQVSVPNGTDAFMPDGYLKNPQTRQELKSAISNALNTVK